MFMKQFYSDWSDLFQDDFTPIYQAQSPDLNPVEQPWNTL